MIITTYIIYLVDPIVFYLRPYTLTRIQDGILITSETSPASKDPPKVKPKEVSKEESDRKKSGIAKLEPFPTLYTRRRFRS